MDYSNKANRVEAGGGSAPFQFIDTGKRERKVASYKEDNFYRQQQAAAIKKRTVVRMMPYDAFRV